MPDEIPAGRSAGQQSVLDSLNESMAQANEDEAAQEEARQAIQRGELNADLTPVDPEVGQVVGPVADANRPAPSLAGPGYLAKQEAKAKAAQEATEAETEAEKPKRSRSSSGSSSGKSNSGS